MSTIRYGLVGLGWWATDIHIPNLSLIPDAEITALCSRTEKNLAKGLKVAKGAPKTYTDFQAMLKADDVDAVVICTPNGQHGPMATAALEAGKHVLVEKPLGLTLADCDAAIAAAKRGGKILQIGVELRYAPVTANLLTLLRRGDIGPLRGLWIHHFRSPLGKGTWRGQPDQYGDQFLDLGIHYLDLASFLVGAAPTRAWSAAGFTAPAPDFTHSWTTLDYPNDVRVCVGLFFICRRSGGIRIGAVGETGRLEAALDQNEITVIDSQTGNVTVHKTPPSGRPVYGFSR
ncbi:MAG: Gfo/Idh/MocA family oxidoreductase, partial [Planctomycetes bacterium]|nr:Gfo/Idh/MocA family oxidoreductase [Planctomycetota bacterium]